MGRQEGGTMNCPYCGNVETRVMDSRDSEGQEAIRRRR